MNYFTVSRYPFPAAAASVHYLNRVAIISHPRFLFSYRKGRVRTQTKTDSRCGIDTLEMNSEYSITLVGKQISIYWFNNELPHGNLLMRMKRTSTRNSTCKRYVNFVVSSWIGVHGENRLLVSSPDFVACTAPGVTKSKYVNILK